MPIHTKALRARRRTRIGQKSALRPRPVRGQALRGARQGIVASRAVGTLQPVKRRARKRRGAGLTPGQKKRLTAFNKLLDPKSVVRQSEFARRRRKQPKATPGIRRQALSIRRSRALDPKSVVREADLVRRRKRRVR